MLPKALATALRRLGLGLASTNMTKIYQLILVMFNGTNYTISVQKIEEPLLTNQLARAIFAN